MKDWPVRKTVAAALLAPLVVFGGAGFWFGYTNAPAALVVTPRRFVGVAPGSTNTFGAAMLHQDGVLANLGQSIPAWATTSSIGQVADGQLCVTGSVPAYGWLQADCSGLTKRVYVHITSNGVWDIDADPDGDGQPDAAEVLSNTPPDRFTIFQVKCRARVQ